MDQPTAEDQISFLTRLQGLVAGGRWTGTYNLAMIMALADLMVEKGPVPEPVTVTVQELAEKFISYYWRQSMRFGHEQDRLGVLAQNPGKQAAVVRHIIFARERGSGSLARTRADRGIWNPLVHDVKQVIKIMPLWKLQEEDGRVDEFLYRNTGKGEVLELLPGVAGNFRRFYGIILDMVQGAWLRRIRRIEDNRRYLAGSVDLRQFLFGSEGENPVPYLALLTELQGGSCFYCGGSVGKSAEVDHFIPWTVYPSELGHNFVLADADCNRLKGDHLAAEDHLARWTERNRRHHTDMKLYFSEKGIAHDLEASQRIACWAYEQAEALGTRLWVTGDDLCPVGSNWREVCAENPETRAPSAG